VSLSAFAAKAERPVPIGAERNVGTHLVPPREDVVFAGPEKRTGSSRLNASDEQVQRALQTYRARFSKFSESWVNPAVAARAHGLASSASRRPLAGRRPRRP